MDMDQLSDSSTLPELSFDDLIDSSPIKKRRSLSTMDDDDDDGLESEDYDTQDTQKDDSLNTPGAKKPHIIQRNIGNNNTMMSAKAATAIRPHTIKTVSYGGNTSAPILLNSKNVLPKTATQTPGNSFNKLTTKIVASTAGSGGGATATMAGKTAVRTSSGQIIYIQKNTSSNSSSSAIKPGNAVNIVKQQIIKAAGSGTTTANKPVTIQVVRNADGNFVPLKSAVSGTNGKNTTLTLSPNALGVKKIVTTSGNQVVIKSASPSMTSLNQAGAVKTIVKPLMPPTSMSELGAKPKTIVVQSTSGKQIIVSNQNMVKLSPKDQTSINSAAPMTSGTGQMTTLQVNSKGGVQYVRVMPKVNTKPVTMVSSTAPSSSSVTKTLTTSGASSSTAPVKLLNNLPQKFTVVQRGTGTKVVLTQKKEGTDGAKSFMAVPSSKPLSSDDKTKLQHTLIKPQQFIGLNNSTGNQSLIRKHKISEINSELQRITTAEHEVGGPTETKRSVPNSHFTSSIVMSSKATRNLNNSTQQPGRVTTINAYASSGAMQVQGTKLPPTTPSTVSFTAPGNKLYTILKPNSGQQQNSGKMFSLVKPGNVVTSMISTTTNSPSFTTATSSMKPLLNKYAVLSQQQQQIFHLKQLQKTKLSQSSTTSSSASSSTFFPVKIKEEPHSIKQEPLDSYGNSTTTANALTASTSNASGQQSLSTVQPPPQQQQQQDDDDPNKLDMMRRKHCNCSKSQCLKLYCDCFANGEFCQDCSCKDCCNNLENEDERQKAIKSCLERNPSAFKPKITSSSDLGDMRLHNKGCNCKRSGCLKNYCECYEAKIPCSSNCKCVGCRNVEDRPDLDMDPMDPSLMAGGKRNYEIVRRDSSGNVIVKTEKFSKDGIKSEAVGDGDLPSDSQKSNFITQEVIDATIQCMITQADECEKNGLPSQQMEKMVMEELGRCLVEIIDFSIRNTDNSFSQE